MAFHNNQLESQKRKLFGIMNKELCEGCFSVENGECVSASDTVEGECPCVNCLIKMVCTVGCESYKVFDDQMRRGINER